MTTRGALRISGIMVLALLPARAAPGYIHFPPMTLQKMCKASHHIRVLKIAKVDREKGVIVYEVAENLKGEKSQITSFTHLIRADAEGPKRVLDWAADEKGGRSAVMFSIESKPGGAVMALAYVFIDEYCYSVDYNREGKYWLFIRGEPSLSGCYFGSAEKLRGLTRDLLEGKDVSVPVKAPTIKEDRERRNSEINEVLKKSRGG
jgi:hypothetical protein